MSNTFNSEVEICNIALGLCGLPRITSLSDNDAGAIACNEVFTRYRDIELSKHLWNFAVARTELAQISTAPAFEWDYQYQLPNDVLRVISIYETVPGSIAWQIEGDYLLTNNSTAKIKYIKRETNVSKFSALFGDVLAHKIAVYLAGRVVESQTMQQRMIQFYEGLILPIARTVDAQQTSGEQLEANTWTQARLE